MENTSNKSSTSSNISTAVKKHIKLKWILASDHQSSGLNLSHLREKTTNQAENAQGEEGVVETMGTP
jgi:hypothetical protein